MVRLFAAVVPALSAVEHLDAFLDPRRAAAPFRWTRPEQLHVTLAFMASVDEHRVEPYVDRLAESLDPLTPVALRLAGSVVFPNVAEGRVLATGVAGEPDALASLERASVHARNAAVATGSEVDGQRFRPHVTLARTGGRPTEMTSWVRLLDTYDGPAWTFDHVAVVASHLGEGARRTPRYETLAEIRL